MAGFLPVNSLLTTTDEYKNISQTITFTDALGVSYPVTIQAVDVNDTINVSGNTITGYYSNSFDNFVDYRTKQDTFVTVDNFIDINEDELYGIYHYRASEVTSRTYTYTAYTTMGDSKTYTVTVTNNWDQGRNTLLRYMRPDYNAIIWVNASGYSVTWVNNNNQEVSWDNNQ